MLETYLIVKMFEKKTKRSSYPQFIVGLFATNSLRLLNDLISSCYQQTINLLLMLHYIIRTKIVPLQSLRERIYSQGTGKQSVPRIFISQAYVVNC
jgi:hypothetical protein